MTKGDFVQRNLTKNVCQVKQKKPAYAGFFPLYYDHAIGENFIASCNEMDGLFYHTHVPVRW